MKNIKFNFSLFLIFFCLISFKSVLANSSSDIPLETETNLTTQDINSSDTSIETALTTQEIISHENLCEIPIELELLNTQENEISYQNIITADTISQEYLSHPSLWWAKQQFDPYKGKLVRNWLAYNEENRIDLVVNRQLWSLMNYLDRYRFLHEFGTVSRSYNFNLRIVNQYEECLATYYCSNSEINQCNNPEYAQQWEIEFTENNSLQIQN